MDATDRCAAREFRAGVNDSESGDGEAIVQQLLVLVAPAADTHITARVLSWHNRPHRLLDRY